MGRHMIRSMSSAPERGSRRSALSLLRSARPGGGAVLVGLGASAVVLYADAAGGLTVPVAAGAVAAAGLGAVILHRRQPARPGTPLRPLAVDPAARVVVDAPRASELVALPERHTDAA